MYGTRREAALRFLMTSATSAGVILDPNARVHGEQVLLDAYERAGKLLLYTAHYNLTGLMLRRLHDLGFPVAVVAGGSRRRVRQFWGTHDTIEGIEARADVWQRVRTALKRGRIVMAMVDGGEPSGEGIAFAGNRQNGYIRVSPFTFAVRTRTPVVFFTCRLADDGVVDIIIEASTPPTDADATAADLATQLAGFVARHL